MPARRLLVLVALSLLATPPSSASGAGATIRVSAPATGAEPDGASGSPSLSADGRFVAFDSGATNLVPGDTNEASDVFVRDMATGAIERVSLASGGQANGHSYDPAISSDGRYVAFSSRAANLGPAGIYLHDRLSGATVLVSRDALVRALGDTFWPVISGNGARVAFVAGRGLAPIYVWDRSTGAARRVVDRAGLPLTTIHPVALSGSGRFLAIELAAVPIVAAETVTVVVHEIDTGTTAPPGHRDRSRPPSLPTAGSSRSSR